MDRQNIWTETERAAVFARAVEIEAKGDKVSFRGLMAQAQQVLPAERRHKINEHSGGVYQLRGPYLQFAARAAGKPSGKEGKIRRDFSRVRWKANEQETVFRVALDYHRKGDPPIVSLRAAQQELPPARRRKLADPHAESVRRLLGRFARYVKQRAGNGHDETAAALETRNPTATFALDAVPERPPRRTTAQRRYAAHTAEYVARKVHAMPGGPLRDQIALEMLRLLNKLID